MISKVVYSKDKPTLSSLSKSTFIYSEKKTKVSSLSEDQLQNKLNQRFRAEY